MTTPTEPRASLNAAAAALWASAFVVAALVIVQAGRLPGSAAQAGMVVQHDDFTIMTADSGRGGDADPDELLYILDSRDGLLIVYEVEDAKQGNIILRDGYRLDNLFAQARGR